jgi:hypothetical protein
MPLADAPISLRLQGRLRLRCLSIRRLEASRSAGIVARRVNRIRVRLPN